jgi:hypothetical protein
MRLIDADLLKDGLRNLKARGTNINYVKGLQDAIDDYLPQIIDDVPTIDAEPVRHGEWIKVDDYAVMCSECGKYEKWIYPYCHCGAKMDGGEKK